MGNRIEAAMLNARLNQTSLAELMGVTPQAVQQWIKEGGTSPKGKRLSTLAAVLKVSVDWLITGNGGDYINGEVIRRSITTDHGGQAENELSHTIKDVPRLSWTMAGKFCEVPGQFTISDYEELIPRPVANPSKNIFALTVRGDSMDVPGGYPEGEIVYIDPDMQAVSGKDVLACTELGKVTLKRYKIDDEGPYLLQLNGNKIIRPSVPWHVCGVVIFSGRKR